VVQVVVRPSELAAVVAERFEMFALLGAVCIVAVGLGLMAHGLAAFGMAVEQICAPVAVFLLMGLCLQQDRGRLAVVRGVIICLAAVEAALALAQFVSHSTLLFTNDFESQSWFGSIYGRWMGTLDHPLVLGLLLAAAVPLLGGLRRSWALGPTLVLLLGGLVVTQSRVGLVLGSVGALYVLASRRSRGGAVSMGLLIAAAGVYAQHAGYFESLTQRVVDDTGSAAARGYAWSYFLDHLADYSWVGGGMGSSYNTSARAGLGTSFENSYVMSAIDLGLIPATMYFGVMLACCVRAIRSKGPFGLPLAATAAFAAPLTFSGLSARSVASCLVWLLFALAAYGPGRVNGQPGQSPSAVGPPDQPLGTAGPRLEAHLSTRATGDLAGPRVR
jgi:hypothetical protein